MKIIKSILYISIVISLVACSPTQSLQEYYVDNSENPNFLSIDIPTSILNLDDADLTVQQKEALHSLRKLNVLAFKKTTANEAVYKTEKANVNAILNNKKFTELMKMNTSYGKATVKYLGNDDAIDEVIIFGNSDDKGFALIRVLGKKMNPAQMIQLLQAIQKSDYKGEGLKGIGEFFKD